MHQRINALTARSHWQSIRNWNLWKNNPRIAVFRPQNKSVTYFWHHMIVRFRPEGSTVGGLNIPRSRLKEPYRQRPFTSRRFIFCWNTAQTNGSLGQSVTDLLDPSLDRAWSCLIDYRRTTTTVLYIHKGTFHLPPETSNTRHATKSNTWQMKFC